MFFVTHLPCDVYIRCLRKNIRDCSQKLIGINAPLIVFFDEIAAITAEGDNLQRGMERWIVTQLLTFMDETHRLDQSGKLYYWNMAGTDILINARDYGVIVDEHKKRVQCNYCAKEVTSFNRMQNHLGGVRGDARAERFNP
ncbi:uncharacterized protein LOC119985842 [Tripterygium wilfordii]|uniref:uncharacterized protein LOC119985842 n=1 Tax=Tripterygium wilfordii TaxID=458696 RepID=UPI0018F84A3F|nr:uncharacterized protein LOC119985842 [Tripterygium wilfordii]